ncbi:MAG: Bor family protein [Cytophagales bacterium]|nr:Bor family protein [Cytophagales bacterium]
MKYLKLFSLLFLVMFMPLVMTSCYVSQHQIGSGAKLHVNTEAKNHYLVFGLVKLNEANTKEMAEGRRNYIITQKATFSDGVLSVLSLGLYTPQTVILER